MFATTQNKLDTHFTKIVVFLIMLMAVAALSKVPGMKTVPTFGVSDDGRYNVYAIEQVKGSNTLYITVDGTVIDQDNLPYQMEFITAYDRLKGTYKCNFVCRDAKNRVVGLDPAVAEQYGFSPYNKRLQ